MSDPINLNRARKDRARAEARALSDQNATTYGLSKAEKILVAARKERAARLLSGHRLDEEE